VKRHSGGRKMSLLDEYQERIDLLNRYIRNPIRLVADFMKMTDLVTQDLGKCVESSNNHLGDNTWQRLVVRAAFSTIDSICFKQNELVYCLSKFIKHNFAEGDEAFLVGYRKEASGKVARCYPGLGKYVKRTLKISSNFFTSSPVDFSNAGWQNFLDSIEIRDKITHPKNPNDLMISQQEYDLVADAYTWFASRVHEITTASWVIANAKLKHTKK